MVVLKKLEYLQKQLEIYLHEGVVIAFSGGVDSAFLLWISEEVRKQSGGNLVALTTQSASMPLHDREDAKQFIQYLNVPHVWKNSQELTLPKYKINDSNRCYYCKSELFRIAKEVAKERNYRRILYGYSASDTQDFRPGHIAAADNKILSPLEDAGFLKEEIRYIMRKQKLKISEKPASPCLSSRIMTGISVTQKRLEDIDALETLLRQEGLNILRVRIDQKRNIPMLRIEVSPSEMFKIIELRERLIEEGKKRGYRWITLDLEGYRMGGGND